MSDYAGKLSQARKFRGIMRGMITHLETQISKMEIKSEITHSDSVIIQGQTEKLKSLDSDFKRHHYTMIELVDEEDLETLDQEQAVLDDHDNKIANMMDRLIRLSHTKPSLTIAALPMSLETSAEPSQFLRRRLDHMESTLRSMNLTVE